MRNSSLLSHIQKKEHSQYNQPSQQNLAPNQQAAKDRPELHHLRQQGNQNLYTQWKSAISTFLESYGHALAGKNSQYFAVKFCLLINALRGSFQPTATDYNQITESLGRVKNVVLPAKLGKASQSNQLKIVIIAQENLQYCKSIKNLQLTVLNKHGKIEFRVTKIKKFQNLYLNFNKVRKSYKNIFVVVQQIDALDHWLANQRLDFQKMLQSFQEKGNLFLPFLQQKEHTFWTRRSPTKDHLEQQSDQQVLRLLKRYNFINISLLKNIALQPKRQLRLRYGEIAPLAYNLSLPVVKTDQISFISQIQQYLPLLQRVWQEVTQQLIKVRELGGQIDHFPVKFVNSHVCWRCKQRTFIGCPRCEAQEGKQIALCLGCYGAYHQSTEVDRSPHPEQQILARWQKIDEQTNNMLDRQLLRFLPLLAIVKSERNE